MSTEGDFLLEITSTQTGSFSNGIPILVVDNDKAAKQCYELARKLAIDFLEETCKGMFVLSPEQLFDEYIQNKTNETGN